MLLYLLLDATSTVAYWLIKNLGFGLYYVISYLYNGETLSTEDKKKKETLEMLIKQNEDIEVIKDYIKKIEEEKSNNKKEEKTNDIQKEELKLAKNSIMEEIKSRNINQENLEENEEKEINEEKKINEENDEEINKDNVKTNEEVIDETISSNKRITHI